MWPACEIPPTPSAHGYETDATTSLQVRYEDITQDGRLQLTSLMPGLGAVWRAFGDRKAITRLREQGVLPILRRLVLRGERGPFSVHVPLSCTGTWRLARELGGDRLFLNMWLEVRAPIAHTFGPRPSPTDELVLVGRAYAEHVITRPFANSAAERKVTRLDIEGIPPLPEDELPYEEAASLIAGHVLEDDGERVFGLMHTDSNQHVNSLVYPRLFEETVVRRLAHDESIERPGMLLARAVELRYRKPLFAGDRVIVACRARASHTQPGLRAVAVGAFTPSSDADKPSATIAMSLA